MTENEVLDLKLSAHLLRLMLDEKIVFERKKGKMDYLIRVGADVNKKLYGKSMALWVKELGNEKLIKYVKEKGGVEFKMSKEKRDELGKQFWDKNGNKKEVKEIRELVLMGADLSVHNDKMEQIWRSLSLEDMNEILKDLPKGYMIDGNVDLYGMDLIELPDFSEIKVRGDFSCHYNKLTALKGAPSEVGGNFECNDNKLKDLVGAPQDIVGDFDAFGNQLETLNGGPKKVKGAFNVHNNHLVNLKGAPEIVGKYFWCSNNRLETLEGAPLRVEGSFFCDDNKLVDLKHAPREVGGGFICKGNQLESLEGKPEYIGENFGIEEEVLKKLEKPKENKNVLSKMFERFD